MPHRLAFLLLVLSLAGCAQSIGEGAAPSPAATYAPAPVAVLELEPYLQGTGLLAVRVAVGDRSLPFLFDTGGGGTIFTPGAAEEVGCAPFGRATGFRHDGQAIHARRCAPLTLLVDGWAAPAREMWVFDLMSLLPDGVPELGGLVALSTFDGLPITLDLGAARMVVESPASLRARTAGMAEVPLRESRQAGGAMLDVFFPFDADGGPVWMELDSGSTGPVWIAPHAAAQLGLDLSTDEPRPVTLRLQGYGPIEVQAQQKEMIYDGLLNAAFLRDLRITVDLAAGRAWVGPADPG